MAGHHDHRTCRFCGKDITFTEGYGWGAGDLGMSFYCAKGVVLDHSPTPIEPKEKADG